jgi:hypothetical protein
MSLAALMLSALGLVASAQPPSLSAHLDRIARAALDSGRMEVRHDSVLLYGVHTNGADTRHGRWACAKVASTVLHRAGALPRVVLGVRDIEKALAKWTRVTSEDSLRPGDVVVWTRRYDAPADGSCIGGGTCHVGVVTSRGRFHNDPLRGRPVYDGLALAAFRFKTGYRAP